MLATALLSPVPRARTKKTVQNAVGRRAPGGSPNRALAPNERSEFLGLDPKEGVFGFKPLPEVRIDAMQADALSCVKFLHARGLNSCDQNVSHC